MPIGRSSEQIRHFPLKVAALFCLLATGLAISCNTANSNSTPSLHHHNWWNYYQRGTHMMEQGDYPSAAEDFERSLGLRAGAVYEMDVDMWRARTYGLHFLEGYFPNRELGICLYQLGQPDKALPLLNKSMQQAPSGRAKYFLNLVHKAQLAQQTVPPPVIQWAESSHTLWHNERTARIKGLASGRGMIREVTINGKPRFIELAETNIPFEENIALAEGTNLITITASDLKGQSVDETLSWLVDWQPPELLVRSIRPSGKDWLIEGVLTDRFALSHAQAEGRTLYNARPGAAPVTRLPVSLRVPAGQDLLLEAEDAAGNQLQSRISPEMIGQLQAGIAYNAWAQNQAGTTTDAPSVPAPTGDRMPPSLKISSSKISQVIEEEYFLDGQVHDPGGIAQLRLNGEDLLGAGSDGSILCRFARRIPLQMGTNTFELEALDRAGNRTTRQVQVIRRQPAYLSEDYRLSLGVPPLPDGLPGLPALQTQKRLEYEILREPVRFKLLERDEGWDLILQEQQLSLSDLADPQSALRIGKMVPAELLLMTTLIPHDKGATVYAKVVETSQGEVICSEDVYSEDMTHNLDYQLAGLIMKIEQNFPLLSGKIIEQSNDKVVVDVGSAQGVRMGTKFITMSPDPTAQVEVLMFDDKPIEMVAVNVKEESATAKILPRAAGPAVQQGNLIYAK